MTIDLKNFVNELTHKEFEESYREREGKDVHNAVREETDENACLWTWKRIGSKPIDNVVKIELMRGADFIDELRYSVWMAGGSCDLKEPRPKFVRITATMYDGTKVRKSTLVRLYKWEKFMPIPIIATQFRSYVLEMVFDEVVPGCEVRIDGHYGYIKSDAKRKELAQNELTYEDLSFAKGDIARISRQGNLRHFVDNMETMYVKEKYEDSIGGALMKSVETNVDCVFTWVRMTKVDINSYPAKQLRVEIGRHGDFLDSLDCKVVNGPFGNKHYYHDYEIKGKIVAKNDDGSEYTLRKLDGWEFPSIPLTCIGMTKLELVLDVPKDIGVKSIEIKGHYGYLESDQRRELAHGSWTDGNVTYNKGGHGMVKVNE